MELDSVVVLNDIRVMRVKADMNGKGPSAAFDLLESKFSSLRGRKFYGTFRMLPDGEEYFACVEMIEGDDADKLQLETGLIPGGKYARRKVLGGEKIIREGRLPKVFQDFTRANLAYVDHSGGRPSIEFYRSQEELILFLPVLQNTPTGRRDHSSD